MVNKVDRAILELKLDSENMYRNFVRVIDRVNMVVANFQQADVHQTDLLPVNNNVAFGSGKECWGFTLAKMARIYSKKFGIDVEKLTKKLWGDNYYDAKSKVWRTEEFDKDGNTLKRAFCMFIMEPICKMAKACIEMD